MKKNFEEYRRKRVQKITIRKRQKKKKLYIDENPKAKALRSWKRSENC